MKVFIIFGTGTDVGKTFFLKTSIDHLYNNKIPCFAIKPIISGYNSRKTNDLSITTKSLEQYKTKNITVHDISLYRFLEPSSPNIAANNSDIVVELNRIVEFCQNKIDTSILQNMQYFFIETAGGLFSTINDTKTCLDIGLELLKKYNNKLDIEFILITNNYLGTISNSISSIIALETVMKNNNINVKTHFIFNDFLRTNKLKQFINKKKNALAKSKSQTCDVFLSIQNISKYLANKDKYNIIFYSSINNFIEKSLK